MTKMPISNTLEAMTNSPRKIALYFIVASIIMLSVYYAPNYFFLEKVIAEHAAILLNTFGMRVETGIINQSVFLENVKIVKDCTGIQVVAVFLGLIIPVPNAPIRKKILTLTVVSVCIYMANLLRIIIEFGLVYLELLPWEIAHYPLSLLLGTVGVFLLVFVSNRLIPEFGDFVFSVGHALIRKNSNGEKV